MSGLGQDYGGRGSGRDTGDGREAEVDNQAWGEELEVREERHQLPHDVQVE